MMSAIKGQHLYILNTEKHTAPASISLPEVTLVCIDTVNPALAMVAMQRCLTCFRFGRALLLTDQAVTPSPGIDIEQIEGIRDIESYSEFVVRRLDHHIKTAFALLVQWDGFIIHPDAWDPAFLNYDYIGATWPATADQPEMVGNGGFSLRSKKLLQALQNIEFSQFHPEDELIARTYRAELESMGIRFAPPAMGDRFAYEFKKPLTATFGFHGFSNFPDFMSRAELEAFISAMPDGLIFNNYFLEFMRKVLARASIRHNEQSLRQMLMLTTSMNISNAQKTRLISDQTKHLISGLCRLRLGSLARQLALGRFKAAPSLNNFRLLTKSLLAR